MNTFYLRVISSNKVFFDDKVTKFVLPLEDGEMAVHPHHENMIIATSIGEIRIDTPDGKNLLNASGYIIMFFADNVHLQNTGIGFQRINSRIDTLFYDLSGKNGCRRRTL